MNHSLRLKSKFYLTSPCLKDNPIALETLKHSWSLEAKYHIRALIMCLNL